MRKTDDEATPFHDSTEPATMPARSEAATRSGEQMRRERIFASDGIPDAKGGVLLYDPTKPFDEMWTEANEAQREAHWAGVDPKAEGRGE